MRCSFISLALVAALVLICSGCGKTQNQQKMESKLNAEVMALQKNMESSLAGFTDLQAKLDATLEMHKELVKKYSKRMKGHTVDDVTAAKKGLDAARSEAETSLKAMMPYDEKMDHNQAMPKLRKDKESLMNIKVVVAGAVSAANAAINNHEKMKSGLMAKPRAKAKTPKKASTKKVAPKKNRK